MAKKREEINKDQQKLYEELRKLAKRANQRIVRLERQFGKDKWAVKNLRDRLDTQKLQAWTKKGRIKYNKSMTITELRAVIKATKQFLNSQTSTKRGIEKVRKKQIEGIQKSLSMEEEEEMAYEEAEALYRLFEDTDFTSFVPKFFSASEFWSLINEAKIQNMNEDRFIDLIKMYIEIGSDVEMVMRSKAIYKKYVK